MNPTDTDIQQEVWSPLLDVMFQYRLSRSTFEQLIRCADIPPTLTSFGIIATNLIPILQYVTSILSTEDEENQDLISKVSLWTGYCMLIVSCRTEIERVIPDFFYEGKSTDEPPYTGFYEDFPLGVALWCRVSDAKLAVRYQLLQAHLFLSHHCVCQWEIEKGYSYRTSKIEAGLAVRNLANPHLAAILRSLPATPLPLQKYRESLTSLEFDREICRLRALFNHVLTGREGRTYEGRIQRRKGLPEELPFQSAEKVTSFAEDDDDRQSAQIRILKKSSLTKDKLLLQQQALCSRDEFTSAHETLCIEHKGPDPSGGFDRAQYRLMAQGYARAVAMHNQCLASDWDRLTPYEIQEFLRHLDRLAVRDFTKIEGVFCTELAAFLAVLFWTSATLETAKSCVLISSTKNCKVDLGIQRVSRESWNWIIKPRVPLQSLVPEKVLASQTLPRTVRFTLPVPLECMRVMKRHLIGFYGDTKEEELFSESADTYKAAAISFLGKVKMLSGGRQTLRRISTHLHDLLARMPGADITTAMSVSGRNDELGSVQLHYTATAVSYIQRCYQSACNEILFNAALSVPQKEEDAHVAPECLEGSIYVGSRYVPKEETVRQLVKDLRNCMTIARTAGERGERQMIDLHNAMTIYTVQMLGYATGYRNVRDPLFLEAEIDRETNFAVISDKDDETYYNTRIIWLPDCCIKQLDYYREHLELFYEWLFFHDQELFFQARGEAVTGRHGDRTNPALFIIWKVGRDNPLQPKVMKHLVSKIGYDLPGNANRHYLRTRLLARKCPVEIIDAFMGHWSRGQEPWSRYSGLSPLVYRSELSRHIVELLENDGWRPEPGIRRLA